MLERAGNLGADLKLESEPGEGARVALEFEYRPGIEIFSEPVDEPQPMAASA
jgi:hypothetical protein